jgi:ADP-heptose:LPS heptosyltransferase
MNVLAGEMIVAAPLRWDEACFAVPAIRALIHSGLELGVLCRSEQREFWQTVEGLKVLDFPNLTKSKVVAAQLSGSWKMSLAWETGMAAEAFKIAGIPKRLGVAERKLNKLLTQPISLTVMPQAHRVRNYLDAVEECGVRTDRAEFFAPVDLGEAPSNHAVLLCPGSDFGANYEWPLERWVEIGKRIQATGKRITVAGSGGGRNLGKSLAAELGDGVEFFWATPMAAVLPLLAVHRFLVAADGSLPHLAAHVGTTCVTLFGPNDPAWKRPLGLRHSVVRRHVECAPCFLAKCPLDGRCQTELDVERVWRVIEVHLA